MKVSFYSLGCKVNLYESEVIINMFKKRGYEIVNYEDKSDIILLIHVLLQILVIKKVGT